VVVYGRGWPGRAGGVVGVPRGDSPDVALNWGERSARVGHSNRLTIDRLCLSSFLIMAIIWTALSDVPPASKKLSFIPICGLPKIFLHMVASAVSSVLPGETSAAAWRGCFFLSRYPSMAVASRSMSYRFSPIRCRRSDRSATPNGDAGWGASFSGLTGGGTSCAIGAFLSGSYSTLAKRSAGKVQDVLASFRH